MNRPSIYWCPPCYGGSPTLPPVFCRSYTGRAGSIALERLQLGFLGSPLIGHLDAPERIPAGSHRDANVTVNGKPLLKRANMICAAEIDRGAL